mgnify:CR=1 FL=1
MSGTTEQLQIRKLQELVFNRVIADAERQGSGAAGARLRINQQGSPRRCQHPLVSHL